MGRSQVKPAVEHGSGSNASNKRKRDAKQSSPAGRATKAAKTSVDGTPASIVNTAAAVLRMHSHKLKAHDEPPVWAEKRAALNDALPYFKAHQGALYTRNLIPKGMLIDQMVGARDHFSSQVIITSCGGGHEFDASVKKMVRTQDQGVEERSVKACYKGLAAEQPVVMIAGAQHKGFPVKPPHYYNVLDNFHITDVWPEKTIEAGQPVIGYMVRLEKVDLSERSWWAPTGATKKDAEEYKVGEFVCPKETCPVCGLESKKIFEQGWTCLNRGCEDFFTFSSKQDIMTLSYSQNFLYERKEFTGAKSLKDLKDSLVPKLPKRKDNEIGSEGKFKQGIVCPRCQGCSRRIHWKNWDCENPGCDFRHIMGLKIVPWAKVEAEHQKFSGKETKENHESVKSYQKIVGKHKFTTYFLPGEEGAYIGSITHIKPSDEVCRRDGGLNSLYENMQRAPLDLQRHGARNASCRIEELTSHFTANYGAPYKFGVVVDTSSGFEDAPQPVLETLSRLTWAGKAAVDSTFEFIEANKIAVAENSIPEEFKPYNEELVLGYFESSKISPHDDGERELGPNVATLSLGSPSIMKFMPKKGVKVGDPPAPAGKIPRIRPAMLHLKLQHGDMVIMHGEKIQKLYLHSVNPEGNHRFALTCRYIRPETLDQRIRATAEKDGKIPDNWNHIRYDGASDRFENQEGREVECPECPDYISKRT
ncbi:hypothetical protein GGS26DRAFT_603401 [Hypomontagnella submonticulosa]|nr:hypothetical protein GGS26DRAFT_603401 [Hypomontagnella submonticulosa]